MCLMQLEAEKWVKPGEHRCYELNDVVNGLAVQRPACQVKRWFCDGKSLSVLAG